MNRRRILQVFGGGGIVSLSGCGAVPGVNSASIESLEPTVEDGRAVISLGYSVDDYATALFEGPDDRVISEARIEPDHSTASLPIGTLGEGEYELLLRQDGETVTSQTLSIEGADPLINNVASSWTNNELGSVTVDLENVGDAPAYIERVEFELEDGEDSYNPSSLVNSYLDVEESRSVIIEPVGGIEVGKPGTTTGPVTVVTDSDTLSSEFSHELEPASLEFAGVDPNWNGNTLVDVTARIRNTGGVPTTAHITATAGGEELYTTITNQVDPGEVQEFEVESFGTLYEATSGGQAEVELTAESAAGSVTETVSREIAGADVSIDGISTQWEESRLVLVSALVSNSGDIEVEAPMTVSVGDVQLVEAPLTVAADADEAGATLYDGTGFSEGFTVTSGGSYEVTVEIDMGDESVTATESKEFDGLDTSFSAIDTTFLSAGFETEDVELSGADFTVQNDGDVLLLYDAIEIEFGGATRTESLISEENLSPGSSQTEYLTLSDHITVSPGQEDLTISLLFEGDEVESTTTTVTAE